MYSTICLLCVTVLLLSLCTPIDSHSTNSLVLVISVDSFRWDYLNKLKENGLSAPNFDRFLNEGGKAEHLNPVYPSKTFPAHFSIATGLYAESHGMVQNKFWDPVLKETFNLGNNEQATESKWFDNNGTVEPIWITNQRGPQTIFPMRSGIIFWPGESAGYGADKMHPTRYIRRGTSINDTEKVLKVVSWFATEDDPINFGMIHLDGVDHPGHQYGTDSKELIDAMQEADRNLGILFTELQKHHLLNKINIIILGDHGMADIKETIDLDEYVDPDHYKAYGYSPMWQIVPDADKKDDVIAKLQQLVKDKPQAQLYLDQKLPEEYHFSHNRRILPIIVTASESYMLVNNISQRGDLAADHGYPVTDTSLMRAFFAARGPSFAAGARCGPIRQVDVYPLLCHLLDLDPRPNNGTMDEVTKLLVPNMHHSNFYLSLITFLVSVGFSATVSGICCVAACRVYRVSRVRRRRVGRRLEDVALSRVQSDAKRSLLSSDEEEI